ncbi:MAG TPA: 3,4-dihydroxy-2-butanone-4-phosphate synthase [Gammaproteobacteria bacterium]|nr:3,4-dihydroxy-2-butanone-4-phosphate synthase [Gammaproteobacteria bacterium]
MNNRLEMKLNTIEELIADIRDGRMVVVMDDEDRENEGDLIMAAEKVTPEAVAFFVRYTSGIICQPMLRERLEELRLPQMVPDNTEAHRTAFTISVDYRHGTTTGISAHDRARTIRALADPTSRPEDFARPGHIFPLRYAEGGVLRRAGHTEATVDLVRAAGLAPTGILCEIVNDDGTMKRGGELVAFAREHGLKIGTIADLIRWRLERERTIERLAECEMPTEYGPFRACAYRDLVAGHVHLALVRGPITAERPALVRVHVQNTLSDVLGVVWDELGWPVRDALRRIAAEGGVLIVLRGQETDAALVQWFGEGRREAETHDEAAVLRTYGVGAQILADLGVRRMRVLSAPKKMHGISGFGLEIVEYVDRA